MKFCLRGWLDGISVRFTFAFLLCSQSCFLAFTAQAGDVDPAALLDAGHVKRARAILEPLAKAHPEDAHVAHLLSRVWLSYDQAGPAITWAEKSVVLDAKNADYHTHFAHIYGWLAGESPVLKQYQYVRLLKREVDAALSLNPKQIDALLIKAVFLNVAPGFVGGDKKLAEETVDQMIQLNPERGHIARARLRIRNKNWGGVEDAFTKALQANPRSYDAHLGLAMLYLTQQTPKRPELAEKHGKTLVQLAPDRVGGYQVLTQVYALSRRWAELDGVLAQAEKAVPDDLAPYYYAALQLEETGAELPRAERYARKYLSQEREGDGPIPAAAHWVLAQALEQEGRKPEAVVELQAALRDKPDFAEARRELKRIQ